MSNKMNKSCIALLVATTLGLSACGGGGGGGSDKPDPKPTPTNDAPTISGTPATTLNELQTFSFTPNASDSDAGDTLTFTINKKPDWAVFDNATGMLSGTPTLSDAGATTGIVISVSDGTDTSDLAAFDLTVNNVVQITGKVIDGYVSGAKVFLDSNDNGVLEADELIATSTTSSSEHGVGHFEILVSPEDVSENNNSNILAYLGEGADDESRNDDDFAARPVTLSAGTVIFDASTDTVNTVISPYSTLKATGNAQLLTNIANYLNISEEVLLSDFIAADLASNDLTLATARAEMLTSYLQDIALTHSAAVDTDNDGVMNNEDTDSDGDGVTDDVDAFPLDKHAYMDADFDGIADFTLTYLNEVTFSDEELQQCVIAAYPENALTTDVTEISCNEITITKFEALSSFENLTKVTFTDTFFGTTNDWSVLKELSQITSLNLSGSKNVDFETLYSFNHLLDLDISYQNIDLIIGITGLNKLETLSIAGSDFSGSTSVENPIVDLSPIFNMAKLSYINAWDVGFTVTEYQTMQQAGIAFKSDSVLLAHINTEKKYIVDTGLSSFETNYYADKSGQIDDEGITDTTWELDEQGRLLVTESGSSDLATRYTWIGGTDLSTGSELLVETGSSDYVISNIVSMTPWLLAGNCKVGEVEDNLGLCIPNPLIGDGFNICAASGIDAEVFLRHPEYNFKNLFACKDIPVGLCVDSHQGSEGASDNKCCAFGAYPENAQGTMYNGDAIAGSCCSTLNCTLLNNG
ncbi:putative Ig domain-containing protein [Thalassotalea fonticola]|uniref:Ig domain-containing protein n=1 Tax=Thalassotalea fonticola TaxID=3065649 RepID=A0ABZ0GST2_9GAMM|nr:putative Ig domain-containing protein [Colwelliaceae bacterium S1-1]